MKVHILGASRDDIGTQFEKLTTIILEREGYSGCNCNKITYGGGEIDVCARNADCNVIYECKAHKNPVNITDWFKFIGKIYTENLINPNTKGVLIALSGVNGNVKGHYEQINNVSHNLVRLIEGEEIINFIQNEYGVPNIFYIRQKISSLTSRNIKEIEIGYYELDIYIICKFTDCSFAVFDKSIELVQLDNIIQYIRFHLPEYVYIDLESEIQNRLRKSLISKVIIDILIKGSLDINAIKAKIDETHELEEIKNTSLSELKTIIENIPVTEQDKGVYTIKSLDLSGWILFYQVVLDGVLYLPIFESEFYTQNINAELLNQILKIQGGISLQEEEFNNCLLSLKYSPYAMQYAINEDQAITRYRQNGKALMSLENLEKGHSKWFIRHISNLLKTNLADKRFYELYLNKYNVGSIIEGTTFAVTIDQNTINFSEQTKSMLGKITNFGDGTSIAKCLILPENNQY